MDERMIEKQKYMNLAKSIIYLENYNKGLLLDEDMPNFFKNLYYLSTKDLILPSKREGNLLALALELNLYYSALFLIENAEYYNIDLDNIAKDNKKKYSTQDELIYSMDTMNDYQRLCDDFITPILELNISSYEKLCEIYNIKKDNKLTR